MVIGRKTGKRLYLQVSNTFQPGLHNYCGYSDWLHLWCQNSQLPISIAGEAKPKLSIGVTVGEKEIFHLQYRPQRQSNEPVSIWVASFGGKWERSCEVVIKILTKILQRRDNGINYLYCCSFHEVKEHLLGDAEKLVHGRFTLSSSTPLD